MNVDSTTNGLLLLDKPAGISSAGALNKLKHRLRIKKIGHAGTLDPMATGLLVCLVGRATKLAGLAGGGCKRYAGSIRMGLQTDSDDITGKIMSSSDMIPDFAAVQAVAREFVGVIKQRPPDVSAVKVEGVRAYKLSRKGIKPQLTEREVEVSKFELFEQERGLFGFELVCSKGTYVRSIARDMGLRLGCGGCLSSLRREASLPFDIIMAKKLDEIGIDDIIPSEQFFS